MHTEAVIWDRVEWRQGDGRYVFEVAQGGLHATFTTPHGHSLTVPTVAWDALLDALAAARKTKVRVDRDLPIRAGARWMVKEVDELSAAFKAGATIDTLAQAHNRTAAAIEAQLAALGLWDRLQRMPAGLSRPLRRPSGPALWPPEPPLPETVDRIGSPVRRDQPRASNG